jgi:hypothetical protein
MLANLAAPDNWTIWLADYRGIKWRSLAIYHHMGKSPEPGDPPPDTHFTSIGIGHLFIQVVGSSAGLEFGFEDDTTTEFRRIWPLTKIAMSWPPPDSSPTTRPTTSR